MNKEYTFMVIDDIVGIPRYDPDEFSRWMGDDLVNRTKMKDKEELIDDTVLLEWLKSIDKYLPKTKKMKKYEEIKEAKTRYYAPDKFSRWLGDEVIRPRYDPDDLVNRPKMKKYLKNVKVGDKLWSSMYGWGRVIDLVKGEYPIVMDSSGAYTFKGYFHVDDEYPSLFFEEVPIPLTAMHRLGVDDKVLVRDNEEYNWTKAHFAKFSEGRILTWGISGTSWSGKAHLSWNYWKLP